MILKIYVLRRHGCVRVGIRTTSETDEGRKIYRKIELYEVGGGKKSTNWSLVGDCELMSHRKDPWEETLGTTARGVEWRWTGTGGDWRRARRGHVMVWQTGLESYTSLSSTRPHETFSYRWIDSGFTATQSRLQTPTIGSQEIETP